jgi:Fic family protein
VNVTEKGAWIDWILYILEAIEITAVETQDKVRKIIKAMEKAKKIVNEKAPEIYSKDLIEIIFKHPYCKIKFIEEANIAKRQTASAYLKKLEELGILHSIKIGREQYYINETLCKIFSS